MYPRVSLNLGSPYNSRERRSGFTSEESSEELTVKLQTSILLAGTGISWLAMTILPPWAAFTDGSIDFLGYAPLWAPITDQLSFATVHIDFARLAIQYMTVAMVWMVITRIEHTRIDRLQQAQPDAAGGLNSLLNMVFACILVLIPLLIRADVEGQLAASANWQHSSKGGSNQLAHKVKQVQ